MVLLPGSWRGIHGPKATLPSPAEAQERERERESMRREGD